MQRHSKSLAAAIVLAMAPFIGQSAAQTATTVGSSIQFVTSQPQNEWLARLFMGADIQNVAGERVGDVNDLMFDPSGRISTVVVGVGGFLGLGEKNVGVRYDALTFKVGAKGERIIQLAVTKESLAAAPVFVAIEKSTLEKVEEKAAVLGQKTVDKAIELKDQAAKKIDDMRKPEPVKK